MDTIKARQDESNLEPVLTEAAFLIERERRDTVPILLS